MTRRHGSPNQAFRDARLRLPSPNRPGEPLSREELADLVNSLDDGTDPDGPVTANHVGKIERGIVSWPRAPRRVAYRAALHAMSDADIGFVNRRRRPGNEGLTPNVDRVRIVPGEAGMAVEGTVVAMGLPRRDALLATIGAVAAASGVFRREGRARVGAADVARMRAVTALYRTVDYESGGGALYREVATFAEAAAGLLDVADSTSSHAGLLTAVAEARQLAGWAAFDAGRHCDAQRHWLSAERACIAGGDVLLAARVRYCQARQFQHLRHNRDAIETLRLARDHLGRAATPGLTAMLNGAEAASLAALGHHNDALKRLASASAAFERLTPDREPEWMSFFDHGEVLAQHGRVYRDMARHRAADGNAAVRWVTNAIAAFGAQNVRSTVLNEVGLCSALFLAGEPEHAIDVGRRVTAHAEQLTSTRVLDRVRNLHRDMAPYADMAPVRDFARTLATIGPA